MKLMKLHNKYNNIINKEHSKVWFQKHIDKSPSMIYSILISDDFTTWVFLSLKDYKI